ncbi:multidrug ABC transporter permease [Actinorhabdospora filicis]|uniref:Multidrug ABC transporter permease n=1 Tax=Actinorhabdospora filicis TaxID=1785913 RepID=A0A9W6WDI7_9ACTN|nr:ABC transporter ATP-binding protein [Actinorhabdospora filicis]GLZ80885.1 multidrug ABC transporter permease [Actinorhabdospora filicis]
MAAEKAGLSRLIGRGFRAAGLTFRAGPVAASINLVIVVLQGLLPTAVASLTALLLTEIPERGSTGFDPQFLVTGLAVLGVTLVSLPYITSYVHARVRRQLTVIVQERLFAAVNRFGGMSRFENPVFLDKLRLAQQAAMSAPDQVTNSMFSIVQGVLSVITFLGALLFISPLMALITVVAAVPVLFIQLQLSRDRANMSWRISPRNRRQIFYQMLLLDLAAVKEVRLFGLGPFLLKRLNTETHEINAAEEKVERKALYTQTPLGVLGALVAGGGLMWMVWRALDGEFSIGQVSLFVAAVAGVQSGLSSIVSSVSMMYQSLLLFGHFTEVSDMASDLAEPAAPKAIAKLAEDGGIELRDVWFRYTDDGPWILKGVDLRIETGRSLALVGLNGAGKSTMVKLLCRLYDPSKGSIVWDGVDYKDIELHALRDRISAVFQDYMSYDLTAAENIGIGDLTHLDDRERVIDAARKADVDEKISELGRGYETMLSRIFFQGEDNEDPETGVSLSGGQWQRIALARALMRARRDLLILDEPSSGLDAAAEQEVHDRLREYRTGATSVLISHRLGAVRHADRIVVLSEGRIIEDGDHDTLMGLGGEYARLFTIQAANYTGELSAIGEESP